MAQASVTQACGFDGKEMCSAITAELKRCLCQLPKVLKEFYGKCPPAKCKEHMEPADKTELLKVCYFNRAPRPRSV